MLKQMHLYFHNMIPQPIRDLFVQNEEVHYYNTRQQFNPQGHKWNTALGKKVLFIWEHIFGLK